MTTTAPATVYVIERSWDWEGSDLVAVAATLASAKRIAVEHNGAPTKFTRSTIDRNVWLAVAPKHSDGLSITREKVLS